MATGKQKLSNRSKMNKPPCPHCGGHPPEEGCDFCEKFDEVIAALDGLAIGNVQIDPSQLADIVAGLQAICDKLGVGIPVTVTNTADFQAAFLAALNSANINATITGGMVDVTVTNFADLGAIVQAAIEAAFAALEPLLVEVTNFGDMAAVIEAAVAAALASVTVDVTITNEPLDVNIVTSVPLTVAATIDGEVTVAPNADWAALIEAAVTAGIENGSISVTVDGGTVEISNLAELAALLEGLSVTFDAAALQAAFEAALNSANDINVIATLAELQAILDAISASDVDDTDDDIRPQVTESKRCLLDSEGEKIANTCVYDVIKFAEDGTPSAFDTVYLVDGSFSTELPEGATVGFCPTKCTTCEVVTGCEIVTSLPTGLVSGSIGGSSTSGFNGQNHWLELRDTVGFTKGGLLENLIDNCIKNKGFIYGEHRNAGENNPIQIGLSMENLVSLIKTNNPADPDVYSSIRIETGPPLRDCDGELQAYWDAHEAGEAPQKLPPNANQYELFCVKYQDITEELPADRMTVCGPVSIDGPVEVTGQVDTSGSQVVSGFICDTDDSRYGDPVWWCQGKDANGNPTYPGGEKCPTVYSGKYTIVTDPDGECRQVSVSKAINGLAEFGYGSGGAGTNTHTLKLAQTALGANLANEIMNGGTGQICTVSLGGGKTFTYDRRNVQIASGTLGDGNSISFSSTLQNDVAGCEDEYLVRWNEQVDLAGETTGYGTSCTSFRFVATGEPLEGDCTLPLDPQPNAIAIGSAPVVDDGSSGCSRWSDVFCEVGTGREYRHLYDCDGNVIRTEFLPEGEEACFNRQVIRGYVDVCIKKSDGTFANMSAMYSGGGTFTKFVDPATQEDYQIAEGDTVHAGHCEEICCGEFCILDSDGNKTGNIADKIRTRCGGKLLGVRYIDENGDTVAANLIDRSCCS